MNDTMRISTLVDELAPELKALAHYIHENPEIGLKEYKARDAQAELLEKYGFEVEQGICGYETAYKAVYKGKKSGPKIAMLAEYDALPGLGHGCGHNLIAMVGVGAGIAMRHLADEYGGEIYVFGTPAEETMGGKVEMSRQGIFNDMDVAMMSHPMDFNGDCMPSMAIIGLRIEFFGKPAHAAAAPEKGINALDAAVNFYCMVSALRQQTKEDARLHGIITKGGDAPNVIPEHTELIYLIRSNTFADAEELKKRVLKCAEAAALGTGCTMKWEKADEDFKDTRVNFALSALNTEQMEKLGVEVKRCGHDAPMGSSDMGDVSYCCPAIQNLFDISGGEPLVAHTVEFTEKAAAEESMNAALTYIKGHVMTAAELMKNPEKLAEIKAEFAK